MKIGKLSGASIGLEDGSRKMEDGGGKAEGRR
jgi:hypothetical protein